MVTMVEEQDATGLIKDVYDDIKQHFGMVPNLFKAMAGVDADWLNENWQREKRIMLEDGPLDHKTRELIAFAVSVANNCAYCSIAHEAMAAQRGATKEELGHAREVIELFSGFNAIANSYPDLDCEFSSPY